MAVRGGQGPISCNKICLNAWKSFPNVIKMCSIRFLLAKLVLFTFKFVVFILGLSRSSPLPCKIEEKEPAHTAICKLYVNTEREYVRVSVNGDAKVYLGKFESRRRSTMAARSPTLVWCERGGEKRNIKLNKRNYCYKLRCLSCLAVRGTTLGAVRIEMRSNLA